MKVPLKKIHINKKLRSILSRMVIALIVVFLFLLYQQISHPEIHEEEVNLYNYNQNSNINYEVLLKNNSIYNSKSLTKDHNYISNYIDHINSNFSYSFKGDATAEIQAKREVKAIIEGYAQDGEELTTIWKKEYTLLPSKVIQPTGNELVVSEDVPIPFQEYNTFAKKILEESRLQSNVKLTVVMNVDVDITTEQGQTHEQRTPSLVIPLDVSYFSIQELEVGNQAGSMKETQQVALHLNGSLIALYSFILFALILGLLYLFFFTIVKQENKKEKQVKKIFKNHGYRLVAITGEMPQEERSLFHVYSIDDLVKIADELGKPIMYQYSSNYSEMSTFYVIDEIHIYVFDLDKLLYGSEMNTFEKAFNYREDNEPSGC